MMLLYQALVFAQFLCSFSQEILVIHPVYAGSHILAVRTLLEELIRKGYKIRVIRWKESSQIPVLKTESVSETILAIDNSEGLIPFLTEEVNASFVFPDKLMWEKGLNPLSVFDGGIDTVTASCNTLLQNEKLLQELKGSKFKLAIVDLIYNECGLALAHFLDLPVIAYWGISFVSGEIQSTTAFNPPSTIPHIYFPYSDDMNFYQRCLNFLFGIGNYILMQIHFYNTNFYVQKYLPNTPHPSTLIANISAMLINSHHAFDYPKQLPPSFFQVGGFHIRKPKELPKDIEEFIEDSQDGVILFSLGKNFDANSLPKKVFDDYFLAFGKLKQKVIVKSKSKPPNSPPNVKVLTYVPQADILAHPKTILFITHCGLHGIMEAIHYGVKMIAVPIFFDQGNVARRLVEKGVAKSLPKTATETEITESIKEVLSNSSYEFNIRRMTDLYHSSLNSPMDQTLWLVEHVLNTGGATYLKLKSKDLNTFQFFSLDVILFFVFCFVFILSVGIHWKIIKTYFFSTKNKIKIKGKIKVK